MKYLSVKSKVLSIIISMSVISVTIFAYLSMNLYMKDKMAYFFSTLSSETKSKADLFAVTVNGYDDVLQSIVSGIQFSTTSLTYNHFRYLSSRKDIQGLVFKKNNAELAQALYAGPQTEVTANSYEAIPFGLSVLDINTGSFSLKKKLKGNDGGFGVIIFKNTELSRLVVNSKNERSFLFGLNYLDKSQDASILYSELSRDLYKKYKELPISSGVFDISFEQKDFFVAYSKLTLENLIYVRLIDKESVFLIQKTFTHQSILFLVAIISITLIIGTISARWLTWHIDQLTMAAEQFGLENFDAKVSFSSKDEFGTLGSVFNQMGEKIVGLLSELKRYNLELEKMVDTRTAQLREVTDIQRGILESLGQGFVLIDGQFNVSSVYSKASFSMFEGDPVEIGAKKILNLEDDNDKFKELVELVFSGFFEFDDMAKLLPERTTNSKGEKIFFEYFPIVNTVSSNLEYIMVVASDKTAEMESIEKLQEQWQFSQMITKIASNRFTLKKVISESFEMITQCEAEMALRKSDYHRRIQRAVHTIKGSFGYFYIENIRQSCHEIESFIEPYFKSDVVEDSVLGDKIETSIKSLKDQILDFVEKYESIIKYKDEKGHTLVSSFELKKFYKKLETSSLRLGEEFADKFMGVDLFPYFESYPSQVHDLSVRLNKKVKLKMIGDHIRLPEGDWDGLFSQFIHLVRNSIDHGIEDAAQREAAGKEEIGQIMIKFEKTSDFLRIIFADDGRGIDWEKMSHKDQTINSLQDAIDRILKGGLSSKEAVSDVSGRGVGVSSLYAEVVARSGNFEVDTTPGKGTRFIIELPLFRSIRMVA
ncbi:MAG: ATP-binding protein [Bacteriovoracaceae bacterium]